MSLLGGSNSTSGAREADFSAPEIVFLLNRTRLIVILAQPANSAFSLFNTLSEHCPTHCNTAVTMDYLTCSSYKRSKSAAEFSDAGRRNLRTCSARRAVSPESFSVIFLTGV